MGTFHMVVFDRVYGIFELTGLGVPTCARKHEFFLLRYEREIQRRSNEPAFAHMLTTAPTTVKGIILALQRVRIAVA
jgi:hypothetical protein